MSVHYLEYSFVGAGSRSNGRHNSANILRHSAVGHGAPRELPGRTAPLGSAAERLRQRHLQHSGPPLADVTAGSDDTA